jgi:transmembrane sensor
VLPDGSVVELGREATVEIDYRGDLRHVRLTHGTAHFEVMKDPQRPFVVDAAGVGVRAVGTAFAVELARDAVEVIVTEGRVAVSDTAAASEKPVTSAALASVGAHERVVIGLASRTIAEPAAVGPEELRDRLAWRVPRLEFNGSPLGEVIALFNEHARGNGAVRLELAGDNLRALPLSGVLRADNVGALLNILESAYGLKSRAGADGRVLVYRP